MASDVDDLSEDAQAVEQLVKGIEVARVAAALIADLAEFAGFFDGLQHGSGSFECVGHHLLAIDMEPCLKAFDGVLRVPKIRGGDDGCIQSLFGGKQFVDVLVTCRQVPLQRANVASGSFAVVIPDIAHRLKVQAGNIPHRIKEHLALLAVANERDVELAVGGGGRWQDRAGQQRQSRPGHGGVEEFAAIHGVVGCKGPAWASAATD